MINTNLLSMQDQDDDTLKGKYLIFNMGKEQFGIEIKHITEIIGMQPITEVPEMPNYVKGITNLRGKIIPVMDARLRFKKEERAYDDRTCIIVIDTNSLSLGLIVDSVSEVITLEDEDIAPPPDIHSANRKYIKGVGKKGDSVNLLLDCEKLISDEETDSLSSIS